MLKYKEEVKGVNKVDKDLLLEDINKVYRARLQVVQDKKDKLWEMEEDKRVKGGNMRHSEYVALTNRIDMLAKDIGKMQLINDGMENVRDIVLKSEVIKK